MWETVLVVVLLLVGLLLIIKGGDFFVDAASWIAEVSGVPKLIVGATVVSLATTLPELLTSAFATADGSVDLAIGNAVGSVTANIALIMAVSILFLPSAIRRKDYFLKTMLMYSAVATIMIVVLLDGGLSIIPAVLLLLIFCIAMFDNIYGAVKAIKSSPYNTVSTPVSERALEGEVNLEANQNSEQLPANHGENHEETTTRLKISGKKEVIINIIKFVLGAAGIVFGAQLLSDNGVKLAEIMGVPERIISITIVAIGTSLPELVTTITAIAKKQSSLSVGNIIGANIIDLTLILPICAFICGGTLGVSKSFAYIDIPVCLLVGLIAMVPTLITKKFKRYQGVLLIVVYLSYLVISGMGIIKL